MFTPPEFSPNGPHKTIFAILKILRNEILTILFFIFVNMVPNVSENSKTLLLLELAAKLLLIFSQWFSQNYV